MDLDDDACYRALRARDARFDGRFFVGVASTGIYCRPICPARTPRRSRCSFFRHAAQAEKAGYRACFRCRPEVAPTYRSPRAPVDAIDALVADALDAIERGALNRGSVDDLAAELGVTGRHLRRSMKQILGVTPHELAQSRRLQIAKQLLHDSGLSVTQVAFAAGFRSVRRFNAAFAERFGTTPSSVRKRRAPPGDHDSITLTLGARPPFAFAEVLEFLAPRAIGGVSEVHDATLRRTVRIGSATGWLSVESAHERAVRVRLSPSLAPEVPRLGARVRDVFDLDARPDAVLDVLRKEPRIAASLEATPGLRVPGAFDPFELALRTIVGQQVSVRAATTLATRIAARFAEPIETPWPTLKRVTPSAATIASLSEASLREVGLTGARARTLIEVARGFDRGALSLGRGFDREAWLAIHGIGPWTVDYLAMRGRRDPDAFIPGDLVLRRRGGWTAAELARASESWRPFRAYAAMHLWRSQP